MMNTNIFNNGGIHNLLYSCLYLKKPIMPSISPATKTGIANSTIKKASISSPHMLKHPLLFGNILIPIPETCNVNIAVNAIMRDRVEKKLSAISICTNYKYSTTHL